MIKLESGESWLGEGCLIAIKGKIGKILNKYEFEVRFSEDKGIKYYEFFYHPSHSQFFVKQPTEITEQEIISAFKEVLALLKNPIEKQKIIDDFIKKEQLTTEWEFEGVKKDIDNYEKQVEDFVLEAEGIKKRPDIKLRFKFLKKVSKNLWEYKTDEKVFRLERYKYKDVWDEYNLYCFNIEEEKQSKEETLINSYRNPTPEDIEDCIIGNLEEKTIENEQNEFIRKIDWAKAVKGISWDGKICKLSLNNDGTIYVNCSDEKRDFPPECVVEGMDVYDKDGNCLSTMKEYEKIAERIIENGYIFYKNLQDVFDCINSEPKVKLNWDKIHRAKGRFGTEFKVEKVSDKKIRIYNKKQNIIWPINIVLPIFDFYDEDGNLVSQKDEN